MNLSSIERQLIDPLLRSFQALDTINIYELEAAFPDQPIEVVSKYANSTIGNLPFSEIDYDLARGLLHPDLRSEFTDSQFIPTSYGFQDGPDGVFIYVTSHKQKQLPR